MSVRRFLVASLFLMGSLLFGRAAHAEMRVAVVDVQRAVMQTEDGLRAQANLKKLFDSRQQELNAKQTQMQKEKDEIEKQSRVISKEALAARADAWQKKMMELQQVFMEYNKELEKKQKELTDPIFERVLAAIKRVAGLDSYDVIVDRATVAFARSDIDLTDRVVQMANGALSAAPAPAAAPAPRAAAPAPAPATPAKP
jgi:outer membrane protein